MSQIWDFLFPTFMVLYLWGRAEEEVVEILHIEECVLLASDVACEEWRNFISKECLGILPDLTLHLSVTCLVQLPIPHLQGHGKMHYE